MTHGRREFASDVDANLLLELEKERARALDLEEQELELDNSGIPFMETAKAFGSGILEGPTAIVDTLGAAADLGKFGLKSAYSTARSMLGSPDPVLQQELADSAAPVVDALTAKENVLGNIGAVVGGLPALAGPGGVAVSTVTSPALSYLGDKASEAFGLREPTSNVQDAREMGRDISANLLTLGGSKAAARFGGGVAEGVEAQPTRMRNTALRATPGELSEGASITPTGVDSPFESSVQYLADKGVFSNPSTGGAANLEQVGVNAAIAQQQAGEVLNQVSSIVSPRIPGPISPKFERAKRFIQRQPVDRDTLNNALKEIESNILADGATFEAIRNAKNGLPYELEGFASAGSLKNLYQEIRTDLSDTLYSYVNDMAPELFDKFKEANQTWGAVNQVADNLVKSSVTQPDLFGTAQRAANPFNKNFLGITDNMRLAGAHLFERSSLFGKLPVRLGRSVEAVFGNPQVVESLLLANVLNPPLAQLMAQAAQSKNPELQQIAVTEAAKQHPDLFASAPNGLVSFVTDAQGKARLLDPRDKLNYSATINAMGLPVAERARIMNGLHRGEFLTPTGAIPETPINTGATLMTYDPLTVLEQSQPLDNTPPPSTTQQMVNQMRARQLEVDYINSGL